MENKYVFYSTNGTVKFAYNGEIIKISEKDIKVILETYTGKEVVFIERKEDAK